MRLLTGIFTAAAISGCSTPKTDHELIIESIENAGPYHTDYITFNLPGRTTAASVKSAVSSEDLAFLAQHARDASSFVSEHALKKFPDLVCIDTIPAFYSVEDSKINDPKVMTFLKDDEILSDDMAYYGITKFVWWFPNVFLCSDCPNEMREEAVAHEIGHIVQQVCGMDVADVEEFPTEVEIAYQESLNKGSL